MTSAPPLTALVPSGTFQPSVKGLTDALFSNVLLLCTLQAENLEDLFIYHELHIVFFMIDTTIINVNKQCNYNDNYGLLKKLKV